VEKFFVIHHSRERRSRARHNGQIRDRRSSLRSTGLFALDPAVLEGVGSVGYCDIKEQLIPHLRAKGVPVSAYVVAAPLPRILGLADYLKLNAELLAAPQPRGEGKFPEGIRIGKNVTLPSSVTLVPPVILGDHVTVGERARIVGPTTIGPGTSIGARASIRASVVGAETHIDAGSVVEESFMAPGSRTFPYQATRRAVVVRERDMEGCPSLSGIPATDFRLSVRERGRFLGRRAAKSAFRVTKRLIDFVSSACLLVALTPIFLIVAVAIRLDSRGPILFKQRRCGKGGRDFTMYKFRTMVTNALAIHDQLVPHKDVDGPMFKLTNDPRITQVGRFLRRTSLDELPQLVNVLKGEMSMVGPRPLIMREMEFAPGWRDLRLSVKPGLTGLWQVNGRSDTAFHDWISHDVSYVRHQSLGLDLRILLSTFRVLRNVTSAGAR
jgi:lipopolysaccharide/colanic/teichoic acid biosynthesis glycosyltransferase